MSTHAADELPGWLPEADQAWVVEHFAVLDAIVMAFQRDREWPDPVALERELRSRGTKIGLPAAVDDMPQSLGWREHMPRRVVLTVFGLGCVPTAAWVLDAYVAVLRLAITRFDDPAALDLLTRAEAQEHLELDDVAMDIVSAVILLPGNPFLAGGQSAVADWRMGIDERVVSYEDVLTADALLARLARERLAPPPASWLATPSPTPESDPRTWLAAGVALAVVGVGANLIGILTAPLPLSLGVLAACITAIAQHRNLLRARPAVASIAIVVVVGMLTAGSTWAIEGLDHTSKADSVGVQLDDVLLQAARDRRDVVFRAAAHFHGTAASQVLVLRDSRLRNHPAGDVLTDARGQLVTPLSDELRVYDVRKGRLHLSFRFLPQLAGQITQLPDGDTPSFRFADARIRDIDENGRIELVGAFERVTLASGPMPVPALLTWDDARQRYRLAPLIVRPPALAVPTGQPARSLSGFTKPTRIRDRYSRRALGGYAVDAYVVLPRRPEAILAAAYLDPLRAQDSQSPYEIKAWTLDLQSGTLAALECIDAGQHVFAALRRGESVQTMAARIARTRATFPCSP